jgi:sortase A
MRANSTTRAHGRRATVLRSAERLFVIAGIVALSWCALLLADARISQWQARRSLDVTSLAASVGPPHDASAISSPRPRAPIVHNGSVIGELSIPRVALDAIVLHGSDTQTLRRGPGHLENTALPGRAGNVVIAGHRDSFFRRLRDVTPGDDVFIDTSEGHFQYRVTSTHVVSAHDMSVLDQTGDATLTLITCYPFWVLGPAPDRFIVRGELVANASFASFSVPPPASYEPVVISAGSTIDGSQPTTVSKPVVHDDTTLVRQAIERFRVTYNARLVSHNDVRPGGLLNFRSCEVALADERAAVTCATGSPSEPPASAGMWTIRLDKTDQGWSIRTIVSDE